LLLTLNIHIFKCRENLLADFFQLYVVYVLTTVKQTETNKQ